MHSDVIKERLMADGGRSEERMSGGLKCFEIDHIGMGVSCDHILSLIILGNRIIEKIEIRRGNVLS